SLDEVVGVMTQRNLVTAELVRVLVESPPAKPRAQRAERLAGLDLLLDGEVDAGVAHLVGVPLAREVILNQIGPEPRKALVDVQREELEANRGAPLAEAE